MRDEVQRLHALTVKELRAHLASYRFLATGALLVVLMPLAALARTTHFMTTLLEVMLSLQALLVTFDTVVREKDQKTLPLLLAQGVHRATVLLGKFLGAFCALLVPLFLGAVLSLAVLSWRGPIDLDAPSLVHLAGVYGSYLAQMLFLGLLISLVSRRASRALTFAVLSWLALVFLLPQATVVLAGEATAGQMDPVSFGNAVAPMTREGRRARSDFVLLAGINGLLMTFCLHRFERYEPE